jgi:hypothetical protein
MDHIATIRRIIDALITGFAVVFGLMPDPTRVPVEYDPPYDR